MPQVSIYKDLKGYILFPLIKSKSGFWISSDPMIRIYNKNKGHIVTTLQSLLNMDDKTIVDPTKITKETPKEISERLKSIAIKQWNDLNKSPFSYCSAKLIDGKIVLTPSLRDPVLKKGYIAQDNLAIEISDNSSDVAILNCIEKALDEVSLNS